MQLTESQLALENEFAARRRMAGRSTEDERSKARHVRDLSWNIDDYKRSYAQRENDKAARRAKALERVISRIANQIMPHLLELLQDKSARNRMIAAAALGFTDQENLARDAITYALEDDDLGVRINACFGLGKLGAVLTPMDQLNKFVSDPSQPLVLRQSASWALYELQENGAPRANFEALWPMLLEGDPLRKDEKILLHALRGLGLLRSPDNLDSIIPYLKHPKPFIVTAALIAAARCQNRRAAKYIVGHLGSHQFNANIRLHARKALQALARRKDVDHDYNVDHDYKLNAWLREFGLVAMPDGSFEKASAKKPEQKK